MNTPHHPSSSDLEHCGLYWLHATGPDGPCVLLGRWDAQCSWFELVDDGCSITAYNESNGSLRGKWTVYAYEPIERPAAFPLPEPPTSTVQDPK